MSEWLLLGAIASSGVAGLPGLARPRHTAAGERAFVALMTLAAVMASVGALGALSVGWSRPLEAPWQVPGGHLSIEVDAIAAMFVLQIALLGSLGAWYGLEYWPQRDHADNGRKLRASFGAMTAAMLVLVVARNGILFLAGWEVMALTAFLLVTTEDHDEQVREVGLIYLLSARAGTLCLFAAFALLGAVSGTLDFDAWPAALASPAGNLIFALGLLGFGLKAGLVPLHVWLPGAHANAPSHVSAVLSGVLIKMGIYGLVRLTAAAPDPPAVWGYVLLAAGAVSAVLGVGFALGQHDLKRLLAYHSVENIGIICLGLGVAVLGRAIGRADLVALGVAGALLHVWNHGLFKALLFLSAGAVVHATGTREIDQLGGLWRRMPRTGLAFLVGAVAICGLPPLNGLVSEWLVYLGLFHTGTESGGPWLAGALSTPALALVGALAVGCFVKVFGAVFLGTPRTALVEGGHDPGVPMLAPMAVLAAACLGIGLGAPLVARVLDQAVLAWAGPGGLPAPQLVEVAPLVWVSAVSVGLLGLLVIAGRWLTAHLTAHDKAITGTWDCGYARPSARMQYTGSSFADTFVALLAWALRPIVHTRTDGGIFPARASFESHVPDTVLDRALRPGFRLVAQALGQLRPIQQGSVHLYLVYILGALMTLFIWS